MTNNNASPTTLLLTTLLLLLLHGSFAIIDLSPEDRLTVGVAQWQQTPTAVLEKRYVKQGETITFTWEGFHNVWIYQDFSCVDTNKFEVAGGAGMLGGTGTYTFGDTPGFFNGQSVVFACDVGMHCEDGNMLLEAYVCSPWDMLIASASFVFTLSFVRMGCLIPYLIPTL